MSLVRPVFIGQRSAPELSEARAAADSGIEHLIDGEVTLVAQLPRFSHDFCRANDRSTSGVGH